MIAAKAVAHIIKYQHVFKTLGLLALTSYLFPKQAHLEDYNCKEDLTDCKEWDIIIIGGGTAGCVLANRLAAANFKVLLLEAGEDQPYESFLPGALQYLANSRIDWSYQAVPDEFTGKCHQHPGIKVSIGKTLGGSSAINYFLANRGIVHDYQLWALAANDSSWEYRQLLPYFKRSERLQAPDIIKSVQGKCRGVGGPPPDAGEHHNAGPGNIGIAQFNGTILNKYLESFKEMGNEIHIDLTGRHYLGYTPGLLSVTENYRQSTGFGYLVPATKYPNLYVSKNTIVTKIIFDENNKAVGVEAHTNNTKFVFKAKKEVIVSAGAIKTPQLLMLSGIGPKKQLEEKNITVISDIPVGANLENKFGVTIFHRMRKQKIIPNNLQTFPAQVVIGVKALEPCAGVPDYGTITYATDKLNVFPQYCAGPFDYKYDICDRAYKAVIGHQLAYSQVFNLYPKSKGKVMLNTTDPDDEPLIDFDYFSVKEDFDNHIKFIKDFVGIVNTTYFKEVNATRIDPTGDKCGVFEKDSDDYWKCYVYCMSTQLWNYSGTCSMGAVVDGELKVFGTKGLRVVDASVIPVGPVAGNYVPTIVVAEKASDMIIKQHKHE